MREELINAKIEGKLQEKTIEKLSHLIKTEYDFRMFFDIFEKNAGIGEVLKNIPKGFKGVPPFSTLSKLQPYHKLLLAGKFNLD